jgi:phospholipase C
MNTQTESPFKRIVVLMMENQSFDHLLGWVPGVGTLDATRDVQFDSKGNEYPVGRVTDPSKANTVNPNHDFGHVVDQMYGFSPANPMPGPIDQPPTGGNFLMNNENFYGGAGTPKLNDYMACYTPEQVPVLTKLATTYTTCARWFSSVPGPTGPNRLFTHCATSGGYNGSTYNPGGNFNPPMKSIFNLLHDANKTWSIYWDGSFSTARALEQLRDFQGNFLALNDFASDVERLGTTLPQYVFITPSLSGGSGYTPNSMHPDPQGTVADGETLITTVYDALASNQDVWNETLLLVVFDEHGGFYDSIMPTTRPPAPPATTFPNWPPEGNYQIDDYDFTNYGVRVPAIVVSAYHPKCVDATTVFEHSSIPKTVEALFGLPNLGGRDIHDLPTFHDRWQLSTTPSNPIQLSVGNDK